MGSRKTATSKAVEYETATCVHCEDKVFVDDDHENIDGLPEGVTVIVGGGNHINVQQTDRVARMKDYRTPNIIVKWFLGEGGNDLVEQHLCRPCADSLYGFST